MVCRTVTLPTGERAIVCGPRPKAKKCACGRRAPLLCDWKVGTGLQKGRTCDVPICASCATSPVEGKDLCPRHAAAWRDMGSPRP